MIVLHLLSCKMRIRRAFYPAKRRTQANLSLAREKSLALLVVSFFPNVFHDEPSSYVILNFSPIILYIIIADTKRKSKGTTPKNAKFLHCYFFTKEMRFLTLFPRAEDANTAKALKAIGIERTVIRVVRMRRHERNPPRKPHDDGRMVKIPRTPAKLHEIAYF